MSKYRAFSGPYFPVFGLKNSIFGYFSLGAILPTHDFINNDNNRLMFKIKDGSKLELQMPETMKLFGSTEKLIDKTKNGENVPSLEVVEVV